MNKLKYIFIILIILTVILVTINLYFRYREYANPEKGEETDTVSKDKVEVEDEGEKNTVLWCVQTYIDTLKKQDTDKLVGILDEEYVQQREINSVMLKFQEQDENFVYSYMTKQNINLEIVNYYVEGHDNSKIIVKIDYGQGTFSIIPCSDLTTEEFNLRTYDQPVPPNLYNVYVYQA